MNDTVEVAITSDGTGQLWTACIWNPITGTTLKTYKGGKVAAPHTLCILGSDYLMISDQTKPVLHAWQLNSQQSVTAQGIRFICPGLVTAMAVSPDGYYCVTAVAEKLHVWQTCSGRHMAVAIRHFQPVTCIRFTDDGSHFVSGGEGGLVLVWPLAYLLSNNVGDIISGQTEPRHVFSDHSLPVRDLYVGPGGMRAHLASVSIDRTCKIYDLASGTLMVSLIFDTALTSVTMNCSESEIFVGGMDGIIYQFGLHSPPRMRDYYLTKEQKSDTFSGHTKAITCLSASKDGQTLLSGSLDAKVMLWHIPSRQCVRVLEHKGPITNAFFAIMPKTTFSIDVKPSIILHSFEKSMEANDENLVITIKTQYELCKESSEGGYSKNTYIMHGNNDAEKNRLREEIINVKRINAEMYNFAKKTILESLCNEQKVEVVDSSSATTISELLYDKKKGDEVDSSTTTMTPPVKVKKKKKITLKTMPKNKHMYIVGRSKKQRSRRQHLKNTEDDEEMS